MILFVNFAPIEFMGGAERWIYNFSRRLSKKEETYIVSVSSELSNIYGRIVLGAPFNTRAVSEEIDLTNTISLNVLSFIPFTREWTLTRNIFYKSRVIYIKFELLEVLLVLYFLGISGLNKTIAGLHTSYIYRDPKSFFDWLHKLVYESLIAKFILSKTKLIHVINKFDENFLVNKFSLKQTVYIPNGIKLPNITRISKVKSKSMEKLKIIFVGELSKRKGVDVLLEVIRKSPKNFYFQIIGDGIMKNEVQRLIEDVENCKYLGYVDNNKIGKYYQANDLLFQPSRAEGMSIVLLEAMSYGLKIVNSKNTSLGLPNYIEYPNQSLLANEYISIFNKLAKMKQNGSLDKFSVRKYFKNHFTEKNTYNKLLTLFQV